MMELIIFVVLLIGAALVIVDLTDKRLR